MNIKLSSLSSFSSHVLIALFFLSIFFIPAFTLAKDFGLENPIGVDSISALIRVVVKVIRYIAIPFVVIAIMYSGWLYIWGSRKGGSADLAEAHKVIRWVIIGSFIILSAELMATVMENTLKKF